MPMIQDLTGMEPPEPLIIALRAAAALRPGEVWVGRLPHRPTPLLVRLKERGFGFEVEMQPDGCAHVRVFLP